MTMDDNAATDADDRSGEPEQRIERHWRPPFGDGPVRWDAQDREKPQPPPPSGDEEAGESPPDPSSQPPGPENSSLTSTGAGPANVDGDAEEWSPSVAEPEGAPPLFESEGDSSQEDPLAPSDALGPPGDPQSSAEDGPESGPDSPSAKGNDAADADTEGLMPASESSEIDRDEALEEGKQINDEAFSDAPDDSSWFDSGAPEAQEPPAPHEENAPDSDKEFFTVETRRSGPADRVEDAIQDFAYQMNDATAATDWTPEQRVAQRTAKAFARLVSKVAEDMSYERRPGDEFWDPRKIMRRQIDNRPLRHCKMEYTKRRLALLVDTSPSCRDEAVFYSKIASGAMLRDDIDIFLCPNGHIDAKFDAEPMRFLGDDRGSDWDLDGRTVLYFTDWDGSDQLVAHSRDCNLYWFDNCPPEQYWESRRERHRRTRLRYRGRHFHCPDPEVFRSLVRKIRP